MMMDSDQSVLKDLCSPHGRGKGRNQMEPEHMNKQLRVYKSSLMKTIKLASAQSYWLIIQMPVPPAPGGQK